MVELLTDDLKESTRTISKKWLYVQEAEAAIIPAVQSWNEGYLPTSKFLYVSEVTPIPAEIKVQVKNNSMN